MNTTEDVMSDSENTVDDGETAYGKDSENHDEENNSLSKLSTDLLTNTSENINDPQVNDSDISSQTINPEQQLNTNACGGSAENPGLQNSSTFKSAENSNEEINTVPKDSSEENNEIQSCTDETEQVFGDQNYELINGSYFYTNKESNQRYKHVDGEWIPVDNTDENTSSDVRVDEDGRTYYYAENQYLCRDPSGLVYYMNDKNEWVLWNTDTTTTESSDVHQQKADDNKWYFYREEDAYYRDQTTNVVYKFNKETNEWEVCKGIKRKRKKRTQTDPDEEFDTESSEESEYDDFPDQEENSADSGTAPPGSNSDPNISFDGTHYTKHDIKDGMTYEWDVNKRAWFPKIDEDFMARYQMNYGFNPDGTKNENPVNYDDGEEELRKEIEREEEAAQKKIEDEKKKKEKKTPGWFKADDAHNTKVYVSNLPLDMTKQQFVDLMQKCGLVLKDAENGEYKVKLYSDEIGNFKGDALCTYIKVESVDLALQILDGAQSGSKMGLLRVVRASFEMKGEYNASLKPKKRRKKLVDKMQKKQEKLFSWHLEPLRGQRGKHENVVILRRAFDPKEFVEHAEKILTHTETLRAQCTSFGPVKKLELFDRHLEGVVKVIFSSVEAADLCITSMHGRLYCGNELHVATWDGKETFRVEESEEEKMARLKKWDEYLVKGGEEKKTPSAADEEKEPPPAADDEEKETLPAADEELEPADDEELEPADDEEPPSATVEEEEPLPAAAKEKEPSPAADEEKEPSPAADEEKEPPATAEEKEPSAAAEDME